MSEVVYVSKVRFDRKVGLIACLLGLLFFIVPGIGSSRAVADRTLIINGQSTQVPVIQANGRSCADLEALANAVNGSLSFAGSQIALSVPVGSATIAPAATAAKTASSPAPASNQGFSKGFLKAGIEQAATLREWHAALCERHTKWISGDGCYACAV